MRQEVEGKGNGALLELHQTRQRTARGSLPPDQHSPRTWRRYLNVGTRTRAFVQRHRFASHSTVQWRSGQNFPQGMCRASLRGKMRKAAKPLVGIQLRTSCVTTVDNIGTDFGCIRGPFWKAYGLFPFCVDLLRYWWTVTDQNHHVGSPCSLPTILTASQGGSVRLGCGLHLMPLPWKPHSSDENKEGKQQLGEGSDSSYSLWVVHSPHCLHFIRGGHHLP